MFKKIMIGLLVVFVAIQFIRPERNQSAIAGENDIRVHYAVPSNVLSVLKRACYDCHSNNSAYPWYTNIQPVGWWIQDHINHGKGHLNFSEFATYSAKKAAHKMEEVAEEVKHNEMPLENYTWMHADAKLSQRDKELLVEWASDLQKQLEAKR